MNINKALKSYAENFTDPDSEILEQERSQSLKKRLRPPLVDRPLFAL